jgi:hypothetical protein
MQGASVTDQSFTPRYLVELTTEGPISIPQTASRSEGGGLSFGRPAARPRATRSASNGPVYVYRCPVCGKSFDRRSMDSSLNAHKNPNGYQPRFLSYPVPNASNPGLGLGARSNICSTM